MLRGADTVCLAAYCSVLRGTDTVCRGEADVNYQLGAYRNMTPMHCAAWSAPLNPPILCLRTSDKGLRAFDMRLRDSATRLRNSATRLRDSAKPLCEPATRLGNSATRYAMSGTGVAFDMGRAVLRSRTAKRVRY